MVVTEYTAMMLRGFEPHLGFSPPLPFLLLYSIYLWLCSVLLFMLKTMPLAVVHKQDHFLGSLYTFHILYMNVQYSHNNNKNLEVVHIPLQPELSFHLLIQ